MKKTYVFDFDKTLTKEDTLLGFYFHVTENMFKKIILFFIYLFFMILFKLKICSNDFLKKVGINLFLKNLDRMYINKKARSYSKLIRVNKIFNDFDFNRDDINIFIISASFEVYVKYMFPSNVNVIGSSLIFQKDKVFDLSVNCYGKQKLLMLNKYNIYNIDEFFTDSFSDIYLAKVSNNVHIIKKDSVKVFEGKNIKKQDF